MARRFVVTTLIGTAVACGHKEPLPGNPPPPPPPEVAPPAPAPQPEPETVTSSHELSRYTLVLNGSDAEDRRIFRRSDGTCYVNLPFPPSEGPPVSFRPPPQQDLACPVHMTGPAWDACAFGTITADDARSTCVCMVMGNPPPPPRKLPACPPDVADPAKEP